MASLRFAAISINHAHIYGQVDCLVKAGAEFVGFHAPEDDLAKAFGERYPQAPRVADRKQLLEDPSIALIVSSGAWVQTIEAFKAFTPAFVISGGTGGPIDSTLFYTLYLYQEAFANFRMGYASALAWILVVIIAAFTALAFLSSRYWVHYDG